jgi:lactoylglutathione lyase
MIRVKDPEKSLSFYQDIMGMKLKRTSENKGANFNLYFLGYGADASKDSPNGVNPVADQEGLLELTWNYGTEKDESFKYHDGNSEPQGFGHICVTVDDIDAACSRFEEKNVSWTIDDNTNEANIPPGQMEEATYRWPHEGHRIRLG